MSGTVEAQAAVIGRLGIAVVRAYQDAIRCGLALPRPITSLEDLNRSVNKSPGIGDCLFTHIACELYEGSQDDTFPGGHNPTAMLRSLDESIRCVQAVRDVLVSYFDQYGIPVERL